MSKSDDELMIEYGITCERVSVYHYKKYRYNNLQDAVNYAKLDPDENPVSHHSKSEKTSSNKGIGESGQ